MGVPLLFRWLSTRFPGCVHEVATGKDPRVKQLTVDCLYLDLNGIIHPCCHPEDERLTPENEEQMLISLTAYVEMILTLVKPTSLLYIAMDGPCPRSKVNQQRDRRFMTAQATQVKEGLACDLENESTVVDPEAAAKYKNKWDANQITPGTAFMESVKTRMRFWSHQYLSSIPEHEEMAIILSDSNVPGEGEHKMIHYMRCLKSYGKFKQDPIHCVVGSDADLILLCLLLHIPNVFILREGFTPKPDSPALQVEFEPHEAKTLTERFARGVDMQIIDIARVRTALKLYFEAEENQWGLEGCIDDFVLMTFLVGNDFLPPLPSLTITGGSLDQLLTLYMKLRKKHNTSLTRSGKINWVFLRQLVFFLSTVEHPTFTSNSRFKEYMARKNSAVDSLGPQQNRSFDCRLSDEASDCDNTEPSPKAFLMLDEELAKRYRQAEDAIKADTQWKYVALGEGHHRQYTFDYYTVKFSLDVDDEGRAEFIQKLAETYTEGIQWCFTYYYSGIPSWTWNYPHHYAPFASDLHKYGLRPPGPLELGSPLNPFEQLMAVLPAYSSKLLPTCYSRLMHPDPTDPSTWALLDFFPLKHRVDPNQLPRSWMWLQLVPPIEEKRLKAITATLKPHLTPEEQERNKFRCSLLIVSEWHFLSSVVKNANHSAELTEPISAENFDAFCRLVDGKHVTIHDTGVIHGRAYPFNQKMYDVCPADEYCRLQRPLELRSDPLRITSVETAFCEELYRPHNSYYKNAQCNFFGNDSEPNGVVHSRFNAKFAKRLILGSLAKRGVIAETEVYQDNTETSNRNLFHQSAQEIRGPGQRGLPYYSVNPYQRETFQPRRGTDSRAQRYH